MVLQVGGFAGCKVSVPLARAALSLHSSDGGCYCCVFRGWQWLSFRVAKVFCPDNSGPNLNVTMVETAVMSMEQNNILHINTWPNPTSAPSSSSWQSSPSAPETPTAPQAPRSSSSSVQVFMIKTLHPPPPPRVQPQSRNIPYRVLRIPL